MSAGIVNEFYDDSVVYFFYYVRPCFLCSPIADNQWLLHDLNIECFRYFCPMNFAEFIYVFILELNASSLCEATWNTYELEIWRVEFGERAFQTLYVLGEANQITLQSTVSRLGDFKFSWSQILGVTVLPHARPACKLKYSVLFGNIHTGTRQSTGTHCPVSWNRRNKPYGDNVNRCLWNFELFCQYKCCLELRENHLGLVHNQRKWMRKVAWFKKWRVSWSFSHSLLLNCERNLPSHFYKCVQ